MPRVSEGSATRKRASETARYHANREHARKVQAAYKAARDEERPFIGWDSEGYDYFIAGTGGIEKGPQRTMLFGCSVPGRIVRASPLRPWLSSREMLDLIIQVEYAFPDAFHVIYSGEYDFNQFLRDLPIRLLAVLKQLGKVKWEGYRIEHVPHKIFTVSKDGITATIYDVFGFFHARYTTALRKHGVGTDREIDEIEKGKAGRGSFTLAEIDYVESYMARELALLPALVECIRTAAYAGGFRIKQWHGPGALAMYALKYNNMLEYKSRNVPPWARAAIRAAYAGGRFQAWQCGEHDGPVWTWDKNSAYVHAMAEMPRLDNGKWVREDASNIRTPDDVARFAIYHIVFTHTSPYGRAARANGIPEPPYPLFHRSGNGGLTWPSRVDGWYWSPEARTVAGSVHARFTEAIVYRDDGTYPWKWVNDAYETRRLLKIPEHYNPAEKAYKWALAAIYGSLARRVGWNKKTRSAPRSHELAWAGFITSHCRASISELASYAYSQDALISVDTDGVTATCDLPESMVKEGFGDGLGQWKVDKFDKILYWQNGIYWLWKNGEIIEAKSRGIPKGRIPVESALNALRDASFSPPYSPAQISLSKHHYVGYTAALNGRHADWRKWVSSTPRITFGGTGKGAHFPPFCAKCRNDTSRQMHTVTMMPPRDMASAPHKLPWLEEMADDTAWGEFRSFDGMDGMVYADDEMEDNL